MGFSVMLWGAEKLVPLRYMILLLADARWRHRTRYPGVSPGASFQTKYHEDDLGFVIFS